MSNPSDSTTVDALAANLSAIPVPSSVPADDDASDAVSTTRSYSSSLAKGKGKALYGVERYVVEEIAHTVVGEVKSLRTDRSSISSALDLTTSAPVILKTLKDLPSAEREVSVLRRLETAGVPHVLRLIDAYDEGEKAKVLVFPRMGKLEWRNADLVWIAQRVRELAVALKALRKLELLHTEICSQNLMCDDSGSL
ncbi:hypothetical protein HK104_004867, partial [Borealophlyctis nickersoniae]